MTTLNSEKKIIDYLKNEYKPDLVLLVDYGAFNLQISKKLKKLNIKTYYFIPPQIWASRRYRIKTIKKNIDKVLSIFPFEKSFYDKEGIDCEYTGHPILSELKEMNNRDAFFEKHGLDKEKKLIGVFPGSRMFEIKFLLDIFKGAVNLIEKSRNDVQFVFSQAESLKENSFKVDYKTLRGENRELLAYSDALILASGTVALEAAMYETPMIIAYKGPVLFYLIYLLVRNIKRACLVNIITNKDYIDEFLMFDADKEKIANAINQILDNSQKRNYILEGCRKTKELLGSSNCAQKSAQIVLEAIRSEEK